MNATGTANRLKKSRSSTPTGFDAILRELGERVRNLRAIRGMSRKALATDANVSERFLADLESGTANVSILLLSRLADAFAVPLDELLVQGENLRPDLILSQQLLSQLSDSQLEEARKLLHRRFASGESAELRSQRIALIGLRGAGKSTLGRALATALNRPFVEVDRAIEEHCGMNGSEIHTLLGQSAYRRYERIALKQVIDRHKHGVVLATPGSIVSEPETYNVLLSDCYTVWIKASPEEHMARVIAQGDFRPMAGNSDAMDDLRRILVTREPLYMRADYTLDTSGIAIEESCRTLIAVAEAACDNRQVSSELSLD